MSTFYDGNPIVSVRLPPSIMPLIEAKVPSDLRDSIGKYGGKASWVRSIIYELIGWGKYETRSMGRTMLSLDRLHKAWKESL